MERVGGGGSVVAASELTPPGFVLDGSLLRWSAVIPRPVSEAVRTAHRAVEASCERACVPDSGQAPFAPGVMSREERDIGFCARYRPIQRTPVRPDAKQSLTRRAPDREAIAEHKRGRSERFPELN